MVSSPVINNTLKGKQYNHLPVLLLSLLTFTIIRWILKLLQFPNPTQVIQLIQSHTHSVLKCLFLVKTLALFQTLEEPWVRQTD